MKKLLLSLLMVSAATSLMAATFSLQPLLSGYNLYVTNGAPAAVGGTNLIFTELQGPIVYSLTNNMGNTNVIAPDAFDPVTFIAANANGDINSNAAVTIVMGYTNLIPIAITNSQGQSFTSNSWPLISSTFPVYMYPATTNTYPFLPNGSATNTITFNFQRGITLLPVGAGGQPYVFWEVATNSWSVTATGAGVSGTNVVFNPPANWLQGFNKFRLNSITEAANSATGGAVGGPVIINGVWFGQWTP